MRWRNSCVVLCGGRNSCVVLCVGRNSCVVLCGGLSDVVGPLLLLCVVGRTSCRNRLVELYGGTCDLLSCLCQTAWWAME